MMKRYLFLVLTMSPLLFGCKQEVLEPEQQISGSFALDEGDGLTTEYLEFNKGYLTVVLLDRPRPLAENKIWNLSTSQSETEMIYTISEGNLHTKSGPNGPISQKDGTLTIGTVKYSRLDGFEKGPYSRIVVERVVTFPYTEQDISIPFTIERPIPAGEVKVAPVICSWITGLKIQDGKITGRQSGTSTDRSGTIKLSYTEADDVTITVRQAPSTFIRPASESLTLKYPASTQTLGYTIENPVATSALTASTTASWITNIQISGTQIAFSVSENNSGAARNGSITLRYTGAPDVTVPVTQKWSASSFTLTPTSKTADYTGGAFNFSYSVNNPREGVTVTATSQANWITDVKQTGTTVSYKIAENNSGASRTGKIKLTYGSYATAEFSVTQSWSASGFSLTPASQTVNYVGGSFNFSYSVNNPREGITVTATSQANWITDVRQTGTTVSYKVAENNSGSQRTGKIKLTYGSFATAEFTVTQSWTASSITMTPSSQTVDYTGGSFNFNYAVTNPRENTTLTVASQNDWIIDVKQTGTTISYKVAVNNSGAQRAGKIKLTYGTYATAEFTVTQSWSASSITMTPSSQTVDYMGGSFSFDYAISNPREGAFVTAASQADWITDVKQTGTTISYKVAENNSGLPHLGKIKLNYGTYATAEFTITQSGKPVVSLTLNKSELALLTGASEVLIATVDPTDAPLQWSSNKTSVATVDQNGKVTAIGNGTATIFVTAGEMTSKCTVTVTTAVTGVSLNKTSLSLIMDKSETLIATINPSTASNKSVTWTSSNISVATVDQSGTVKAIANGTATIMATTVDGGYTARCTVTVIGDKVDLSLPSGLKWASWNLGANSPEEYGNYYAWGETGTKSRYAWATYKWCNGSSQTLTKYNTQSFRGPVDNITELQRGEKSGETVDDVARAKLGGKWRMPTHADFTELLNNTNMEWTTYNNVKGYKFTSKTSSTNWIFLPAAGYRSSTYLSNTGSHGYYWSSSLSTGSAYGAWYLYFYSGGVSTSSYDRCEGRSVRPVTE